MHGGGWAVGDKSQYAVVGHSLARAGVRRRHRELSALTAGPDPAHARTRARAVAWCYRQAPYYGADPERFCVIGHSSGAHLAALVSARPDLPGRRRSRVVGDSYTSWELRGSATDLNESYATPLITPFLTPVFGSDCSRWSLAAPLGHVTSTAPPSLLIDGLSDTDAPPASTQVFADHLARSRGTREASAASRGERLKRGVCRGAADPDFRQATEPSPASAG